MAVVGAGAVQVVGAVNGGVPIPPQMFLGRLGQRSHPLPRHPRKTPPLQMARPRFHPRGRRGESPRNPVSHSDYVLSPSGNPRAIPAD